MISKQLTLLQVMEKQLESVQARLQLEVEGAGQAILRSPAPSSNHISSSSPSFAVTPSRSTGSSALIAASMINTSTYSFPYYHSLLSFYWPYCRFVFVSSILEAFQISASSSVFFYYSVLLDLSFFVEINAGTPGGKEAARLQILYSREVGTLDLDDLTFHIMLI